MRRYTIGCVMKGTHLTEFLPCSTCLAQLREARVHDWVLEDVHFRHGHLCTTAAATTQTQIRLFLGKRGRKGLVVVHRRGVLETRLRGRYRELRVVLSESPDRADS